VGTPLLVREIIANLKKDPSLAKRLPVEVVRELARKMNQAHGVQPADFRKLAIANLCGAEVPMFGQVPVDTEAPGDTHLSAALSYVGPSPEFPGLYQVNFQLSAQIAGAGFPGGYPPLFPCGDYNWEISLDAGQGYYSANLVQIPVVVKRGDVACAQ
jgi:hypothetical protein